MSANNAWHSLYLLCVSSVFLENLVNPSFQLVIFVKFTFLGIGETSEYPLVILASQIILIRSLKIRAICPDRDPFRAASLFKGSLVPPHPIAPINKSLAV